MVSYWEVKVYAGAIQGEFKTIKVFKSYKINYLSYQNQHDRKL